jgi:DNA-binding MarR family transcriptional regulator
VNIAAAMAALKVDDLDSTAKFALVALACHADRDESVAKVRLADLADELVVDRGNAWRALKRVEKAGHVSVEKVGYTGRLWHIRVAPARRNQLELVAQARRIAEKASRPRDDSSRQRDALKKIFRFKDLEDGDASLAQTASAAEMCAPPVDNLTEGPTTRRARNLAGVANAKAAMQEAANRRANGSVASSDG